LFYQQSPAELVPALVPSIQQALAKREQFVYVGHDSALDAIAAALAHNGINFPKESKLGRVKLWSRQDWRQSDKLNFGRKSLQIRDLINDSICSGFNGIRFAVDVTWTLGQVIDREQIELWEAALNTIFVPGFPAQMICHYDRSRLSPEMIRTALRAHPPGVSHDSICLDPTNNEATIGNGHDDGPAKPTKARCISPLFNRLGDHLSPAGRPHPADMASSASRLHVIGGQGGEEAARHLAAIVESSADGIIATDLSGIIISWNQGAERLFGYADEEVIGQADALLSAPERQSEGPRLLERIRRGERIHDYGTVARRKDGTRVQVSITISPVKDAQGRIVGISKIARDISERKRAEKALREVTEQLARSNTELEGRVQERTAELTETNSQLEAFVSSIAHDLRAPLRAIQSFASILTEEYGPNLDDKGKDYAQRIVASAERLDGLVLDLLAYARVARTEMSLSAVNVQDAWAMAVAQYEQLIAEKGAYIEAVLPLPNVRAHKATLAQVLANLLSNALKFVAPGVVPHVRLRAEERLEMVRLWVEDNGMGISPEYHERVFRLFERLHGKEYSGTGIGLSIVRKGVERMGGRVGLESAAGPGTRFWIELPRAEFEQEA